MNLLVLNPKLRTLGYAAFSRDRKPALRGILDDYRAPALDRDTLATRISTVYRQSEEACSAPLDGVALRVPCVETPGSSHAVIADHAAHAQLESLATQFPLHAPAAASVLRACADARASLPVALVHDSAFFATLPPCERAYALDPDIAKSLGFHRRGYHGLFHEAACRCAGPAGTRIMSLCLEPQPEATACRNGQPVMVSGGTTLLEGLPGETSSGEVDPAIVLELRQRARMGPDEINRLLGQESGLGALAGRPMSLPEALVSSAPDAALAGQLMQYRFLQACGAGMAVLGGLDAIVFSGRYARLGALLGPHLVGRLHFPGSGAPQPAWTLCEIPLEELVFDKAACAFAAHAPPAARPT